MNQCDFTYKHYKNILTEAKQHHKITSFEGYKRLDAEKFILLRHDIDFSLDVTLTMAKLEHSLDIHSTYFILMHSPFYNIFTEDNRNKLLELVGMGHDIGLHYDARLGTSIIEKQIEMLGSYMNKKISAISKHNPFGIKVDIQPIDNIMNAYATEYTKKIKYISDSSQIWREGCLCQNIDKYDRMQVLVHPEWWGDKQLSPDRILMNITDNLLQDTNRLRTLALDNLQRHRQLILKGEW